METVKPIPQLLIQHAKSNGRKVAFSAPNRTVTYAELEARTGRLGGHLVTAGIKHGQCVALVLGRTIETVECTLAVTRAGAVGLPLDPRSSEKELFDALTHSEAAMVITDGQRIKRVRAAAPVGTKIITVAAESMADATRFEDLVETLPTRPAPDDLTLDEPAWLMYTSGTTGNRKGVLSSQQAWLWSATHSAAPALGMTSADRLWWPLPLFHALGHSACTIGTVALGATAHLPGDEPLLESLLAQPVTVIAGVPTTYRELVAAARATPEVLPRPRACITAGAPAPSGLSAAVEELFGVPLLNRYGCTETSGAIAANRPGESYREDSCGTPLPGMEVRLVDPATMTDVIEDQEGEVWVRSPSLMLRYHSDNTNSPFVNGWYRTGDLGRKVALGRLAVTGRLKELIIRGGENIHPTEVEKPLRDCPGVEDVVVAGIPHDMLGEVPAAFIVPKSDGVDLSVLLAACRAVLPDYKVPASFYELDVVPRTSTGKPRRGVVKTLTARPLNAHSLARDGIESLVMTETAAACGIPSTELVDPVQPFAIWGLTSLAGIVLRDRLSSLTGLELPPTLVFNYPTPVAVAEYLSGRLFEAPSPLPTSGETSSIITEDNDSIAIVSVACRYPGGISSPADLWNIVSEGINVTSDFPTDRGWDINELYDSNPDSFGTSTTLKGGFLQSPADFDAGLFGVSPREALATDPQQRLLLETSWELIERARIAPSSLRGSKTGVFVGLMYAEYAGRWSGIKHELEAHLGLGSAASVAAGRISYALDLRGPSLAVDTACSSSLVAMHLAAASLRARESSLAIAGGVTIMSTPHPFVMFSRQRGLAPDGICRSYSADAQGTGWSEGVGLILLERLSDARRNGHHVMGILRGTAVNSDGTSNGLAAPSGPAQERVIQQALDNGRLSPADIDVIEGHGTATQLGDPIEIQALIATYGRNRITPALLGSIKSNIGHSQAAAGVAGVIKMLLAMNKSVVPASLNISKPSQHVDWHSAGIELLTEARDWPSHSRPKRAAVSSFGIGGTNAHIIIEEYVDDSDQELQSRSTEAKSTSAVYPFLFSGNDEVALHAQARAIASLQNLNHADIAKSLAISRSPLAYRAFVPSTNREALLALAEGKKHGGIVQSMAKRSKIAFIFSGQGTQRPHMGRELRKDFRAFDAAFAAACEQLDSHLEHPLSEIIESGDEMLNRADFAQAAVFAFQVAVFRLLESFGIRPDYVAGHSIGEITAAHVSGLLSLTDAVSMVAARGSLMRDLPGRGAMASVSATESEVKEVILSTVQTYPEIGVVAIGAVNAERSIVVSGDEIAVTKVMNHFAGLGRRTKRLRVSHAFHSPLMEPMLESFSLALRGVRFQKLSIPLVSTVTGKVTNITEINSPAYWVRHVSMPVRFADAVDTLRGIGANIFTEIGPSSALAPHVSEAFGPCNNNDTLFDLLGRLHVNGVQVDWEAALKDVNATLIDLPVYPFQRRRYWLDPPMQSRERNQLDHPILQTASTIPGTNKIIFSGLISQALHPWVSDHSMGDKVLFPATAMIELSLRAAKEVTCDTVEELALLVPLVLPPLEAVEINLVIGEECDSVNRSVDIYSRPENAPIQYDWTHHATGMIAREPRPSRPADERWPSGDSIDISSSYKILESTGIAYGPAFQCVRSVWRNGKTLQAQLRPPISDSAGHFTIHPALLDAALHVPLIAAPLGVEIQLPFLITGVRVFRAAKGSLRAQITQLDSGQLSVMLTDQDGISVAQIASVSTRSWLPNNGELYHLEWHAAPNTLMPVHRNEAETIFQVKDIERCSRTIDATHEVVSRILTMIQKWSKEQYHTGSRLVVVTERATVDNPDPVAAAAWGLVRSAQAELESQLVLVDLDESLSSVDTLQTALGSGQNVIAVRNGVLMVPRLASIAQDQAEPNGSPASFDKSGTVLVTGGTGGLGSLLSRHLAETMSVKHLLLVSRKGRESTGTDELCSAIASCGAAVRVEACDVSDRAQLKQLLQSADPPVTTVIHSAGVVDDAVVDAQTPERVSRVLRPKVDAAWNLHELLPENCSFILFSSAAGMLGNRGQAGYAAGNCFLDALARVRTANGLPTYSMAWGPWLNEAGMASTTSHTGPLAPITDQQGLDLFEAVLRTAEPVVAPLILRGPLSLSSKRVGKKSAIDATEGGDQETLHEQLISLPESERRGKITQLVSREVAAVLGYEDGDLPAQPFAELGLDSFMGLQLRNRLSVLAGQSLPGTVAFDYGTIPALSDFLLSEFQNAAVGSVATPQGVENENPVKEPVLRLASIYQQLCQVGQYKAATYFLSTASLALPTFGTASVDKHAVLPKHLASGSERRPVLVCLPDFTPKIAGLSIYSSLAAKLGEMCDVFELAHPTRTVPDAFSTLAILHANTIRTHFANRAVILLGFSAGGCVAHAVASQLEAAGSGPKLASLILIDTYVSTADDPEWHFALPATAAAKAGAQFDTLVSDTAVATMGAYLRLSDGWQPAKLAAPLLFLQARDQPAGVPEGEEWRATWQSAEQTVVVPGSHLEILATYAEDAASAIRDWIGHGQNAAIQGNGKAR